ncbi:hypothetical protein TRV_07576 [Trichophyton verrucosum HKI 0517]|uniref:Uncharacterized protein n=1 Tax=Trichophyton verrucosum (strain HKI 0517) TaxID=663202 RepID=D4DK55_TRIVH|nr:uncharacterized protein TRV_07576 [Trichophyton verrucosum HKI 0517]EFE37777.1 hypothetical protein TRV_07576 [Trichophyton verrucosum HKI 0517]
MAPKKYETPALLSSKEGRILETYVHAIKKYPLPNDPLIPKEIDIFLRKVFSDWTSDDKLHSKPDRKGAKANFHDTAVRMGTLTRDLPSSEDQSSPEKSNPI